MYFKYFLILIYIYLTYQKNIQNGVYNILNNHFYFSTFKNRIHLSENFIYPKTFFRIKKEKKILNEQFYYIEEIERKERITLSNTDTLNLEKNITNLQLWNIIEINENNYIMKNFNNCYLIIDNLELVCHNVSAKDATNIQLILIYKEIEGKNSINSQILDKEPIDVLIKYIDLKDPNLIRNEIHQIEKDYDNEELRYSVRSIFKNIPWIRKIFILMPNEKVRYFKEYNLIKNKIVYVKDKDILGYDSSNCNAFIYRYWKMKKFGISDNIILMDDDFFIRNKLEKKDFFYVKNNKVIPYITTSNFVKTYKGNVQKNCEIYERKAKSSKEEQNEDIFLYVKFLTYNFIYNIFNVSLNESLFIPFYTHNAIPINLNDAKEVYDLIYNSKYKYGTLDCHYRYFEFIHFQIFISAYTFIKYKRKVNHISHKYVQLNKSLTTNYKVSLFCINKGAGYYPYLQLFKEKIILEYLFPVPSPYEIIDHSFYHISFNTAHTMEEIEKRYENQISHMIPKKDCLFIITNYLIVFFLIIYKIIINKFSSINSF